jgi:nucleoside-diphosphate-sugar epimerase
MGEPDRILVTGATGFIGAALCRRLLSERHDVAVLGRSRDHWRIADFVDQIKFIEANLADIDAVGSELQEFRPIAVAHLAWDGVGGADRNDMRQVDNIAWTTKLIAVASRAGAKAFVGVGSQAEYGPKTSVISEDSDTNPTTLYGEAKLSACRLSRMLCDQLNMRFAWARVFSTYGPGDHPRWMIPGLIGQLLEARRPALTAGSQLWDYLHVDDAASALATLLTSRAAKGVYNLGSGHAQPLRATVETVRDAIDPSLELGWGEVPYRDDQVMILQADVSRLRELGWSPQVELTAGLQSVAHWYLANRWIYAKS